MDEGAPHYLEWDNQRRVAWIERGDPDGIPVFYAHGNPGSRLELLFFHEKAREHGFRLIVFDRPGFGKSDFVDGYPLLAFADDVKRLADELGIERFGLIGWSSGGPPVLATARHMPRRVRFVFSISGYTNFGEYEDGRKLMAAHNLYGPGLSEKHYPLFNGFVKVMRWTDLHLPNFYLKLARGDMKKPDRRILDNPEIADLFLRNQQEGMAAGTRGAIQDLETQWKPWDFSLTQIEGPVHVFQGKQDVFVPWEFARHMAATIPDAALHLYDDQGHLFPLLPAYQAELFELARCLVEHRWN
ncbi:MAG: alpha/beta hydrolase [Desulfobacterales bacterium]|nr:alpha/beta hydrolase [Desulfobacterales bacterium]